MGLIDRVNPPSPQTNVPKKIENNFSLEEIDVLIRVLSGATAPVRDIEPLYRAIYKLQELRNKLKQDV